MKSGAKFLLFLAFMMIPGALAVAKEAEGMAKISWDSWGVPHVESETSAGLFYGFGYAQMKSRGDLILRLYGISRGLGAEYFGKKYKDSDKKIWIMGIPGRAKDWYEKQNPEFKSCLDAFAQGVNAYAARHPETLSEESRQVLPVNGADIVAHAYSVIYFKYMDALGAFGQNRNLLPFGSNAWAIDSARSESGHAMLLANPHTAWSEESLIYEAHLRSPGLNLYGGTLVGFPVLMIAFNDFLGWTHTVNSQDGTDLFELQKTGRGYLWEGGEKSFEAHKQAIKIRQYDSLAIKKKFSRGPLKNLVEKAVSSRGIFSPYRKIKFWVKQSVYGPVVSDNKKKAISVRVAGMDRVGMLEQWWQMGTAANFSEFQKALENQQLPAFSVIYADREGHIAYSFGGMTPKRPQGNWSWSKVVSGTGPENLWTEIHPFHDLPLAIDPASGWLQNANDSPWSATVPEIFDQSRFPEYLAPWHVSLRAQRSIKTLMENPKMNLDQMIQQKHNTHVELADRILDELIPAAKTKGSPTARRAAAVLESWDRQTEAESRGAVLFAEFIEILKKQDKGPCGFFLICPDQKNFLKTPDGIFNISQALVALEVAAREVELEYGSLEVPWGRIYRLRQGNKDLPANGGPASLGVFRDLEFIKDRDRKFRAVAGDSFVMAVEFSDPPKAKALISYGNASGDSGLSLELFSKKELRPVWRSDEEIQAHLKEEELV